MLLFVNRVPYATAAGDGTADPVATNGAGVVVALRGTDAIPIAVDDEATVEDALVTGRQPDETAADVCGRDDGGPVDVEGIGDGGTLPDNDDAEMVGTPFCMFNVNGGG